jgi:hypothetical protein
MVLEVSTLIAMLVNGLIAWAVVSAGDIST